MGKYSLYLGPLRASLNRDTNLTNIHLQDQIRFYTHTIVSLQAIQATLQHSDIIVDV